MKAIRFKSIFPRISGSSIVRVDYLCTFLKYHIFRNFRTASAAHDKIVEIILIYLKMIDQTQWSLIRPICDDKHFTAAAHFWFECETLKNQFDSTFVFNFNFQNNIVTSSGNELSMKISQSCCRQ